MTERYHGKDSYIENQPRMVRIPDADPEVSLDDVLRDHLRALMKRRDWGADEVACLLEVSRTTANRRLAGMKSDSVFNLHEFIKICVESAITPREALSAPRALHAERSRDISALVPTRLDAVIISALDAGILDQLAKILAENHSLKNAHTALGALTLMAEEAHKKGNTISPQETHVPKGQERDEEIEA